MDIQQATIVILYKNTKDKLLRTNAAIWYNEVCTAKHLAPKQAHTNIKDNNTRNVATKEAAKRYRNHYTVRIVGTVFGQKLDKDALCIHYDTPCHV